MIIKDDLAAGFDFTPPEQGWEISGKCRMVGLSSKGKRYSKALRRKEKKNWMN